MKLDDRCKSIELIIADVDGVFTDGGIIFDNQGIETKVFHVRDGLGVKIWKRAGYRFGILTARASQIVKVRAGELGIDVLRQGFEDKSPACRDMVEAAGVLPEHVAYIGDDLTDLPAMRFVGLAVAVADAVAEVRSAAHLVTEAAGGRGAVRETVETILKAQQRWDDLIRHYQL